MLNGKIYGHFFTIYFKQFTFVLPLCVQQNKTEILLTKANVPVIFPPTQFHISHQNSYKLTGQ